MINRAWQKLKVTTIALGTVVLLQPSHGFSTSTECGDALQNLDLSETDPFDSKSIDQKIQNLAELKLSLDLSKANGTSSIEISSLKIDYERKEKILAEYLEKNEIMSEATLVKKIKQRILILQESNRIEQERRNEAKEREAIKEREQERLIKESAIDGTRMIFHKVKPGDFVRRQGKVAATLTTMPEIMATPMTQIIYKKVAELANARFPEKYQIKKDPSHYKGGARPVESVSYEEVELWTKALNELSEIDEPELKILIPSHKKGMRYQGFMTEAQREYLLKMAKTENDETLDEIFEGEDKAKLKEYVVFDRFRKEGTALVDSTKPLFIDGKEFYGLSGNVMEWVLDDWGKTPTSNKGGVDPVNFLGFNRTYRGNSWAHDAQQLRFTGLVYTMPSSRNNEVGFRLVRVVE